MFNYAGTFCGEILKRLLTCNLKYITISHLWSENYADWLAQLWYIDTIMPMRQVK